MDIFRLLLVNQTVHFLLYVPHASLALEGGVHRISESPAADAADASSSYCAVRFSQILFDLIEVVHDHEAEGEGVQHVEELVIVEALVSGQLEGSYELVLEEPAV